MQLIPALDMRGGGLVKHDDSGAYVPCDQNIAEVAQRYQDLGFPWLHLYDLDAASGGSMNAAAIGRVLQQVSIPVQIAGGLCAINRVSYWIEAGATRVVLDSCALHDPGFLHTANSMCPDRIAATVELSKGQLMIGGQIQAITPEDAAHRYADAGIKTLLVVDRDREASKAGVNAALMADMARAAGMSVIACGGVSSATDIETLKSNPRIKAAVIGRALIEGWMTATDALGAAA